MLKAFTEVHTILHTYYHVQEAFCRTKELRDASAEYMQLAQLQFRAGMTTYIDVLDAQRSYFDAQIAFSTPSATSTQPSSTSTRLSAAAGAPRRKL